MRTTGRTRILVPVLVLLLALTAPAAAEEKEARLETVEVVATPIIEGNRITDYASEVTVVTGKQIENSGAMDLPSALRRVPGVNISRYNLIGSYGGAEGGAVYIRGMGAERPGAEIQTLIDGKPILQGFFSHPLMDLLAVDLADRIEVYKGAQPVFLGNMSSGAVNIVTKRRTTEGFESRLMAAGGTYNTLNTVVQHGGKVDRLDYYLAGGFKSSPGHRENAGGQLKNYFARLGYDLTSEVNVSFTGMYTDSGADDPGRVTASPVPVTPRFGTRDGVYDLTASHLSSWGEGLVKVFQDEGVVRWRQYDSTRRQTYFSNTDWRTSGVKLQEKLRPWTGGEVVLGYDFLRYGGSFHEERLTTSTGIDDTYFINSAPYVAVSQTFGSTVKVTPSAGIRYNMNSDFGDEVGWEAGVVGRWRETELHARYARGFNYPGLYVLYMYQTWNQGDRWRTLQVEKVDHYEVGLSQAFPNHLRGDVTFFWDYGKDRLVFKAPPPHFVNLADYHTRGVEATLNWSPLRNLELFCGGTYLDRSSDDVSYAPHYTLTGGATWQFLERFLLSVDAQYVSAYFVSNPRYPTSTPDEVGNNFLLNAKLSWRLTPKESRIQTTVFVSGENLTDRQYEYLRGYPAPGITVMGGVNVSL
jgi:iron complex outermembrane receptor protein